MPLYRFAVFARRCCVGCSNRSPSLLLWPAIKYSHFSFTVFPCLNEVLLVCVGLCWFALATVTVTVPSFTKYLISKVQQTASIFLHSKTAPNKHLTKLSRLLEKTFLYSLPIQRILKVQKNNQSTKEKISMQS